MLLPEPNGLIPDEQARPNFRKRRCRCCDEPRPQLQLAEQTAQQIAGRFRSRVELDLFCRGDLADVRHHNAINRAIR